MRVILRTSGIAKNGLAEALIPRPEHIIWGCTVIAKPTLFSLALQSLDFCDISGHNSQRLDSATILPRFKAQLWHLLGVTLGKSLNLCFRSHIYKMGINNSIYPTRLFQGLKVMLSSAWYYIFLFILFLTRPLLVLPFTSFKNYEQPSDLEPGPLLSYAFIFGIYYSLNLTLYDFQIFIFSLLPAAQPSIIKALKTGTIQQTLGSDGNVLYLCCPVR